MIDKILHLHIIDLNKLTKKELIKVIEEIIIEYNDLDSGYDLLLITKHRLEKENKGVSIWSIII